MNLFIARRYNWAVPESEKYQLRINEISLKYIQDSPSNRSSPAIFQNRLSDIKIPEEHQFPVHRKYSSVGMGRFREYPKIPESECSFNKRSTESRTRWTFARRDVYERRRQVGGGRGIGCTKKS